MSQFRDSQYEKLNFHPSELPHKYGKNIHILSDPYLMLGLSQLCSDKCVQPMLHFWVGRLYRALLQAAVNACFDKKKVTGPTRMHSMHPEAILDAKLPDPESQVIIVDLARAGIIPSFFCYDELNYFFNPKGVRQDHIILSRTTDAKEKVTGSQVGASKIGGKIDNNYMIIPDPMGATGSTISRAVDTYKEYGIAKKWIALHLVITPEYVAHIQKNHPEVEVFTLRLDRGLSSPEVLQSGLGERWAEEKGLNPKQYIVPGAGGIGEILNNSWV